MRLLGIFITVLIGAVAAVPTPQRAKKPELLGTYPPKNTITGKPCIWGGRGIPPKGCFVPKGTNSQLGTGHSPGRISEDTPGPLHISEPANAAQGCAKCANFQNRKVSMRFALN